MQEKKDLWVQPEAWASFLRCCARTRELYVPRLGVEAVILRMLLRLNKDKTFFSSRSLSWQETPSVAGMLTSLVHSSLQTLQISIDPDVEMSADKLGSLIAVLSVHAPEIENMVIQSPDGTRSFPVDAVLRHVHLRELTLGGDIAISGEDFWTLLSLPHLHSLQVNLAGTNSLSDDHSPHSAVASYSSMTLRNLAFSAPCDTADALLSLLNAPSLQNLALHVDEARYDQRFRAHSTLLRTIAGALFANSLLSLEYASANIYSELAPKRHQSLNLDPDDILPDPFLSDQLISDILAPFFPASCSLYLPLLERFSFEMFWPMGVQDGDMQQLSAAFGSTATILERNPLPPSLRAISVAYPAHLTTMRRLADRCPDAEVLTLVVEYDLLNDPESPTMESVSEYGVGDDDGVGYAI